MAFRQRLNMLSGYCSAVNVALGVKIMSNYLYSLIVFQTLYFTLVYPCIIYGITLCSAAYQAHLSIINVWHKKIIRSIYIADYNDHTNGLLDIFNILKLQNIARHQLGISYSNLLMKTFLVHC